MSITRIRNGAYCIVDITDGVRVHQTYYFYTRREAVALFRRK
jgi:hypothetical protein